MKALDRYGAVPTQRAPAGVRVPAPEGAGKAPHLEAETAHGKGWFEVQDEGSQIAALLAGAGPRMQVLDLCAGAGGKTLALAAAMQNTGQIYAYDADKKQLRPIFERLKRAGVRNVQVMDAGDEAALTALGPRFDLVLVDAPCTGSGTWRRKPDAKWRVKPGNIPERQAEQVRVLDLGAGLTQARRYAGVRDVLGAAGGEPRPGRGVSGAPRRLRRRAVCGGLGRAHRRRAAALGRWARGHPAIDAGPARDRRLLHRSNAPTSTLIAASVAAAENSKLPLAKSQLANKFANYRGHRGLLFCSADRRLTGAVSLAPRAAL